MTATPTNIRAHRDEREFELCWPDGSASRLPFRRLRESCPCAACVDETTGERILDPASIPDDIRPTDLGFSGNYALRITWSDGHNTGLYTWELLERLCRDGLRS